MWLTHAHTPAWPDDDSYYTLHVEDDVQGIYVNECTWNAQVYTDHMIHEMNIMNSNDS